MTSKVLAAAREDCARAIKAIAEGYTVKVWDDRWIGVRNPDYQPDNGSNPNLVIDAASINQFLASEGTAGVDENGLKPCPFCSAKLVEHPELSNRSARLFAHPEGDDGCPARSVFLWTDKPEGIAAWNRRPALVPAPEGHGGRAGDPPAPDVAALIERLERAARVLKALPGEHYSEAEPCSEAITALRAKGGEGGWRDDPAPERDPFPSPGDKVRYLAKNGYDHDREHANKVMKEGDVLTVKAVSIGDWHTSLQFEEVPGRFNSVMFEALPTPLSNTGGDANG